MTTTWTKSVIYSKIIHFNNNVSFNLFSISKVNYYAWRKRVCAWVTKSVPVLFTIVYFGVHKKYIFTNPPSHTHGLNWNYRQLIGSTVLRWSTNNKLPIKPLKSIHYNKPTTPININDFNQYIQSTHKRRGISFQFFKDSSHELMLNSTNPKSPKDQSRKWLWTW